MISAKENKMCIYCAKWYPEEDMWSLKNKLYCRKCYPTVYENVGNLPWNKGKPPTEWK